MSRAEAASSLHRALASAFPQTEVELLAATRGPERWGFRAAAVGDLGVFVVDGGAHRVRHAPALGSPWLYSLMVQLEGRCEVEGPSGDLVLEPGQLALTRLDGELALTAHGPYRQVFVLVPGGRLGAGPDRRARPTLPADPVDRLVFDYVRALAEVAPALGPERGRDAAEALLANLRLSSPMAMARAPGRSRFERALDLIDARLSDPELSAEAVAAAQGVSRRHLDGVFRGHGTTLARAIGDRRLDRAAHLLRASTWRDVGVLGVALECGFVSASHFARAFRARFGVSPSSWRRGALGNLDVRLGPRAFDELP